MSYVVDVQIASSGEGSTTVRLASAFETLDEAKAAGSAYVGETGLPAGAAFYDVIDEDGRVVASTENRDS